MNPSELRCVSRVIVATTVCAFGSGGAGAADVAATSTKPPASDYIADGRATLAHLLERYESLAKRHGWQQETSAHGTLRTILPRLREPAGHPSRSHRSRLVCRSTGSNPTER